MFGEGFDCDDARRLLLGLVPTSSDDRLVSEKVANSGEVASAEKVLLAIEIKR